MSPRWKLGIAAFMVGSAINYFGDRTLGVTMEVYRDLLTAFSGAWVVDIFLVPFVAGIGVSVIFGRGSWWLCYFPPLFVRCVSYFQISQLTGPPEGFRLIPMGWWGFFVILAMEACTFGGFLGEVVLRRVYHRSEREKAREQIPAPRKPGR